MEIICGSYSSLYGHFSLRLHIDRHARHHLIRKKAMTLASLMQLYLTCIEPRKRLRLV